MRFSTRQSEDVTKHINIIHSNIINALARICDHCLKRGVDFEKPETELYAKQIIQLNHLIAVDPDKVRDSLSLISKIWEDKTVKTLFKNYGKFHLPDGVVQ